LQSRSPSFSSAANTNNELAQHLWDLREQGHFDCTLQSGKTQIGVSHFSDLLNLHIILDCQVCIHVQVGGFQAGIDQFAYLVAYWFGMQCADFGCIFSMALLWVCREFGSVCRWIVCVGVPLQVTEVEGKLFKRQVWVLNWIFQEACIKSMTATLNDSNFPARLVFAYTNDDEYLKQKTIEYARKTPQLKRFQLLSASPVWSSFSCANSDLSKQISEIIFPE
jgi:hypothetical protein